MLLKRGLHLHLINGGHYTVGARTQSKYKLYILKAKG